MKRLAELLGDRGGEKRGLDSQGLDSVDPAWCSQQLLRLWDGGVVKNATPHYVENLSGIFRRLGLCDSLVRIPVEQRLCVAVTMVGTIGVLKLREESRKNFMRMSLSFSVPSSRAIQ